jgi:hypothetical protein
MRSESNPIEGGLDIYMLEMLQEVTEIANVFMAVLVLGKCWRDWTWRLPSPERRERSDQGSTSFHGVIPTLVRDSIVHLAVRSAIAVQWTTADLLWLEDVASRFPLGSEVV